MRFLKYLQEEYVTYVTKGPYMYEIYKDPSSGELKKLRIELMKKFGRTESRYLIAGNSIYVFPAELLHDIVIKKLNLRSFFPGHIQHGQATIDPTGKMVSLYPNWRNIPINDDEEKFLRKYFIL